MRNKLPVRSEFFKQSELSLSPIQLTKPNEYFWVYLLIDGEPRDYFEKFVLKEEAHPSFYLKTNHFFTKLTFFLELNIP